MHGTGRNDLVKTLFVRIFAGFIFVSVAGCAISKHEDAREETMQPLIVLEGHTKYISSLAFLDAKHLVSASFDETIKVWDLQTEKELYTLDHHKEQIGSIAVSPDGNNLASRALFEGIIYWKIDHMVSNQYRLQKRIQTWQNVTAIAFSPNNITLAIGEGYNKHVVHLYNLLTSSSQAIINLDSIIEAIAFSPNNKILVVTSSNNTIVFYDLIARKKIRLMKGHFDPESEGIDCVAFSPDGSTVATGGVDRAIRIWSVNTGSELFSLIGHKSPVKSISFSPNGKLLASGECGGYNAAGVLKIWDFASHQELKSFSAHPKPIRAVSFSPDGKLIATGSEDNTVKLWEVSKLLSRPTS